MLWGASVFVNFNRLFAVVTVSLWTTLASKLLLLRAWEWLWSRPEDGAIAVFQICRIKVFLLSL